MYKSFMDLYILSYFAVHSDDAVNKDVNLVIICSDKVKSMSPNATI